MQAKQGSEQAWHVIVQIYGPLIYAWARKSGWQAADASDVMQEVLGSLHTNLSRFDPASNNSKFRAWLWTITRNRMLDFHRRKAKQPAFNVGSQFSRVEKQQSNRDFNGSELSIDSPTSDTEELSAVLQRCLAVMRQRFAPATWKAFWETTIHCRSVEDVADELNMNKWSVYKARTRVLKRLREQLEGLDQF